MGDRLLVRVNARAVDGKATEAALQAVAAAFSVRPHAVSLISGLTTRDKLLEIQGDSAELSVRLAALRLS